MYIFDYDNQAWIKNGLYIRCGHPESMNCHCYGKEHEGERAVNVRFPEVPKQPQVNRLREWRNGR